MKFALKNIVLLSLGLAVSCAWADESLFGFTYGAETMPKGAWELQTSLTHRWDKGMGTYQANDWQAEVEYGITDRLTASAYLLYLQIDHQGAFPLDAVSGDPLYPDRKGTFFRGSKFQLKYNLLSPYLNDGWGLAIFAEPQFIKRFRVDGARTRQFELEGGVILQKNLLDDQLVLAYNSSVSRERRVLLEDNDTIEHEFEFTNIFGASYRVAPKWYAGVEARHHMDVLKSADGGYKKNQYSLFLGPTLHYADKGWWVTTTWLRQLRGNPTYASSAGPTIGGVNTRLHLDENEKNELRVKVGYEF